MSLLPKQIIPPTTPIGTLQADGSSVLVDKNWWLFLYNIYLNSIGGASDDDSALLASILFPADPSGAGGGSGTVTSVSVTSEADITGTVVNPTTTPALDLQLTATGVSAGTYGDATDVPVVTVDTNGRITTLTTIPAGPISGAAAYDDAVLADSPIHYWKCNEKTGTTLADAISGANNFPLTIVSGGTGDVLAFQQLLYGDYGFMSLTPAAYNTQNGAQGSGLPADITYPMTYSYTFECIVNPIALYTTNNQNVFMFLIGADAIGSSNDNIQLSVYIANASGWTLYCTWMYGTNTGRTTTGPAININNHHIIVQKDSVNKVVDFYVDGIFRSTSSYSGFDCTGGSLSNININRNRTVSGVSLPYQSCISRVAFYNTLLSADRIAAHALYAGYYPGA